MGQHVYWHAPLWEVLLVILISLALGEYDTYRYDSHQDLGYYTYGTYGLSQKETAEISPAGTPYTITLYPNEQFPVHVFHR